MKNKLQNCENCMYNSMMIPCNIKKEVEAQKIVCSFYIEKPKEEEKK